MKKKEQFIKTQWLNNKTILKRNLNKEKPCHELSYCPYGELVEEFPFKDKTKFSCKTFGHCCPCFFLSEDITEE